MKILDVEIDNLSRKEILERVEVFLNEPWFHQIATVNPEFLVEADLNAEFKNVLNECDLRVADGIGIVLTGLFFGKCISRFVGADLMEKILEIANEKKLPVYLAVRAGGLSSYGEVEAAVLKKYPNIIISGQEFKMEDVRMKRALNQKSYSQIVRHNSKIIFSNFGAPHQETFLAELKTQNTGVRLTMGVGGSFDYLTGKQKRAPKWLRAIGLEWLWRLLCQPSRIIRIWNATAVFLFKVINSAIMKP